MKISHYRAGAYALLAISLINAVYQQSNDAVLARSLVLAAIAGALLALTLTKSFMSWMERAALSRTWWTLIVIGIIADLIA